MMSPRQTILAALLLSGILGLSAAAQADEAAPASPADKPAAADKAEEQSADSGFYQPFAPDAATEAEAATEQPAEAPAEAPAAPVDAAAESAATDSSASQPATESDDSHAQEQALDPSGFYASFVPAGLGADDAAAAAAAGGEAEAAPAGSAEAPTETTDAAPAADTAASGASADSWGDAPSSWNDCPDEAELARRKREHVFAQDTSCGGCCPTDPCDGSGNWFKLGWAFTNTHGNEDSVMQYGVIPSDWITSGKLHIGDAWFSRQRFELRWDDVQADGGRAWGRATVWPFTLEGDSWLYKGRTWDSFGAQPALLDNEVASDNLKLRLHSGEWDNMLLSYSEKSFERKEPGELEDYSLKRLDYQYNFDIGCDLHGQFKQTATAFDAEEAGFSDAQIDNSQLKLNADLSSKLEAWGDVSAAAYNYDELPDSEMSSQDYRFGLRLTPGCRWEIGADYRGHNNPDDNTVSSHVQNFNEMGLSVAYNGNCGNYYEIGMRHRELDYAKLNMQDAFVFSLLRNSSYVVRPADVAAATTVLTPSYDETYLNLRQHLGRDFFFTTQVNYTQGDGPGSELTHVASPSLFFDERLTRSHGLSWIYDNNNQFDFRYQGNESSNGLRNTDFDTSYVEGTWTHCMDDGKIFTFGVRDSDSDLGVPDETGQYTTSDRAYEASYSQEDDDLGYSLRFAIDDGSGAEDFHQTSAGADLNLKCLGPVGLKLDWYDRSYRNYPGIDGSDLSLSVVYKLKF